MGFFTTSVTGLKTVVTAIGAGVWGVINLLEGYGNDNLDNEMPYGRVPQGHPVIVNYFYHEEIRGTENTGKRNR